MLVFFYDNVCLNSVSTNYWITNSSFYNLSNLVTTINNEVNTINYNIGNTFTCFQLNATNWATIGSLEIVMIVWFYNVILLGKMELHLNFGMYEIQMVLMSIILIHALTQLHNYVI